jgi:hypothetical protein
MEYLKQINENCNIDEILKINKTDPFISSNICEAIIRMHPGNMQYELFIEFSPGFVPEYPKISDEFRSVFTSDHLKIIDGIRKKLSSNTIDLSVFCGTVDSLLDSFYGEVIFTLLTNDSRKIRAKGYLDPNNYEKASMAHMNCQFVIFEGILNWNRVLSLINRIENFNIMD